MPPRMVTTIARTIVLAVLVQGLALTQVQPSSPDAPKDGRGANQHVRRVAASDASLSGFKNDTAAAAGASADASAKSSSSGSALKKVVPPFGVGTKNDSAAMGNTSKMPKQVHESTIKRRKGSRRR
mmetsp:Transcript_57641/g.162513  ORF Transcript_57641/g.162513 Transcript_57641/m.162513 type:complete len:126 (+) Transcript_57641:91-468(+)